MCACRRYAAAVRRAVWVLRGADADRVQPVRHAALPAPRAAPARAGALPALPAPRRAARLPRAAAARLQPVRAAPVARARAGAPPARGLAAGPAGPPAGPPPGPGRTGRPPSFIYIFRMPSFKDRVQVVTRDC